MDPFEFLPTPTDLFGSLPTPSDSSQLLRTASDSFPQVSIPTYLALTESERLYAALQAQGIAVNRAVLNRLLIATGDEDKYLEQVRELLRAPPHLHLISHHLPSSPPHLPLISPHVQSPPTSSPYLGSSPTARTPLPRSPMTSPDLPSDLPPYLQLSKGQLACLSELRELASRAAVEVTEVPYFDAECRAVYGLRALGAALLDTKAQVEPVGGSAA